jgi:hypothetical protein
MKKILLTTVAVAAVIGFTGIAVAQNSEGQSKGAVGGQEEQKAAPGAMHPQNSTQSAPKTLNPSAQSGQGAKPDDRVGQGQDQNETKTKTPQRGAQDEQRGGDQKGAQEDNSKENSKSGANTGEHANQGQGAHGASAQLTLTQTQRTRIGSIIGKGSAGRVTTNVNFNVAVGVAVPRSVHVEVLPADVVEVVPEYEGFDYVVVGDNILIIDPDSMEIVAVIPV